VASGDQRRKDSEGHREHKRKTAAANALREHRKVGVRGLSNAEKRGISSNRKWGTGKGEGLLLDCGQKRLAALSNLKIGILEKEKGIMNEGKVCQEKGKNGNQTKF